MNLEPNESKVKTRPFIHLHAVGMPEPVQLQVGVPHGRRDPGAVLAATRDGGTGVDHAAKRGVGAQLPAAAAKGAAEPGGQPDAVGAEDHAWVRRPPEDGLALILFGPAYKGIPLAVVTAIAYHELYGKEVRYCSDRKEAKDHGADKGGFLGSKLKDGDRVVMIEDVTTSGKSMEETVPKVREAADVTIVGLMVSLNRMEVGQGGKVSALDEIHEKYGFEGKAIVTMEEVTEYLYNREHDGRVVIDDTIKAAIDEYYKQYGCK